MLPSSRGKLSKEGRRTVCVNNCIQLHELVVNKTKKSALNLAVMLENFVPIRCQDRTQLHQDRDRMVQVTAVTMEVP